MPGTDKVRINIVTYCIYFLLLTKVGVDFFDFKFNMTIFVK